MHENARNEAEDVEAAQHLLNSSDDGDEETVVAASRDASPLKSTPKQLLLDDSFSRYKDSWFSLKFVVSLALLVIFSVLSFAAAYSAFSRHATKLATPTASESDTSNDGYLLDMNWDFDAPSQTREYSWTIRDQERNPDGVYRPMIIINEQFPGPLVEVNEGDTIVVHIDNQAVNSTSIHWHGMYQNGSNFMDGTVGVTQCPIAPGTQFTYKFKVDGQSGTYWYHAHHAAQSSDGVYGPLVVHSKDERKLQKIQYATDRIVMVSDHYYDLSGDLLYQYLQPDRENKEPIPGSALINGQGIRNCDDLPNRKCDNSTAGVEMPRLDLEAGQSHRLRFINTGAFAEFQVQLDEHEFAVTEADGTDLIPKFYHRLLILPAQRYSIVISTNHTDQESYWLRARMVTGCFKQGNKELSPEIRAVVRYTNSSTALDSPPPTPKSRDWPDIVELQCHDLNTTELEPVIPIPPPAKADQQLYFRSNFEIGAWRLSRGFFNTSSWRAPVTSPSLNRFVDGIRDHNISFVNPFGSINSHAFHTKTELVYQTKGIQTIDILISNFDDGAHPFHLHGHKFWILASGKGYPPNHVSNLNYGAASSFPSTGAVDAGTATGVNLKNPLYRDTATVNGFGWALLRFVADNAGVWAFHCHITWHAEAGLLMQFAVRTDEMEKWEVPQEMRDMCSKKNVTSGKGPDDSIWFGDFGGG
ncbi:putative multicopper oxidase, type 1 [Rhizodiscina lignyota]|uniref:Multicopper oxidase, type 1 n=1 Tax=Rhizodiscina lignyota TaxID=1504668 RepID=A0A9P4M962_9PEZI|nr:putative multicopper oxidase, type 1 [Rhizodiscina lignyota]